MNLLTRSLWLTLAATTTITAIGLGTVGCVWHSGSLSDAYGSGQVTSEERTLGGPVRRMSAGSAIQVRILPGERVTLRLTAPADMLPPFTSQPGDIALHLNLLSGTYNGENRVVFAGPAFCGLQLTGASTITTEQP